MERGPAGTCGMIWDKGKKGVNWNWKGKEIMEKEEGW